MEEDLKDVLSTPNPEDAAFFRELEGDRVIPGVGSQIGPSLARRAGRAAQAAGAKMRIIGTAVHCGALAAGPLAEAGVKIQCVDLLDPSSFGALPDAPKVIFIAGRKFGSTGGESLTWAMNAHVSALVALPEWQYLMPVVSGVATEAIAPEPLGEYSQSVLPRERRFEYFSACCGTSVTLLRLNYAAELRCAVWLDIDAREFEGRRVKL